MSLVNSRRCLNCRRKKRSDVFNWYSDDSSAYSHDQNIRSHSSSTTCSGWMPRHSTYSKIY